MSKPAGRILTALEIGTTKVTAVLSESADDGNLNIIGCGRVASAGVIKGVINDLRAASERAHAAIDQAERQAGVKSEGVYLALTGGHLDGFENEATVAVSSPDGVVRRDDVENVVRVAKHRKPPAEHSIVHFVRGPFALDNQVVSDPLHLKGNRLAVRYWIVHGRTNVISDAVRIVNGFNLRVVDAVVSSIASAQVVTTREERKAGVLVLDLGGGTTDYVLYRDGYVVATGVVPVGGDHLSNDLSIALRTPLSLTDNLKLRCGRAVVQSRDRNEKVWLSGDKTIGDRQFSLQAIEKVVSLRTEEIFELVKRRLGAQLVPSALAAGAVLTGGTSQLAQIEVPASRILGVPVRTATHPEWIKGDLAQREYSTVLGLLYCAIQNPGDPPVQPRKGILERLLSSLGAS